MKYYAYLFIAILLAWGQNAYTNPIVNIKGDTVFVADYHLQNTEIGPELQAYLDGNNYITIDKISVDVDNAEIEVVLPGTKGNKGMLPLQYQYYKKTSGSRVVQAIQMPLIVRVKKTNEAYDLILPVYNDQDFVRIDAVTEKKLVIHSRFSFFVLDYENIYLSPPLHPEFSNAVLEDSADALVNNYRFFDDEKYVIANQSCCGLFAFSLDGFEPYFMQPLHSYKNKVLFVDYDRDFELSNTAMLAKCILVSTTGNEEFSGRMKIVKIEYMFENLRLYTDPTTLSSEFFSCENGRYLVMPYNMEGNLRSFMVIDMETGQIPDTDNAKSILSKYFSGYEGEVKQ